MSSVLSICKTCYCIAKLTSSIFNKFTLAVICLLATLQIPSCKLSLIISSNIFQSFEAVLSIFFLKLLNKDFFLVLLILLAICRFSKSIKFLRFVS